MLIHPSTNFQAPTKSSQYTNYKHRISCIVGTCLAWGVRGYRCKRSPERRARNTSKDMAGEKEGSASQPPKINKNYPSKILRSCITEILTKAVLLMWHLCKMSVPCLRSEQLCRPTSIISHHRHRAFSLPGTHQQHRTFSSPRFRGPTRC